MQEYFGERAYLDQEEGALGRDEKAPIGLGVTLKEV